MDAPAAPRATSAAASNTHLLDLKLRALTCNCNTGSKRTCLVFVTQLHTSTLHCIWRCCEPSSAIPLAPGGKTKGSTSWAVGQEGAEGRCWVPLCVRRMPRDTARLASCKTLTNYSFTTTVHAPLRRQLDARRPPCSSMQTKKEAFKVHRGTWERRNGCPACLLQREGGSMTPAAALNCRAVTAAVLASAATAAQ